MHVTLVSLCISGGDVDQEMHQIKLTLRKVFDLHEHMETNGVYWSGLSIHTNIYGKDYKSPGFSQSPTTAAKV